MIGYLKSYGRTLLASVGYTAPIGMSWSDDNTACTNGIDIQIPREFLGLKLYVKNRRPRPAAIIVAKGLVMHEIIHHLQPLDEIAEVEKNTGIHHNIVNLVLDAQLERMALILFKKEAINLIKLRKLVRRKMMATYKADYPKLKLPDENGNDQFGQAAQNISLISRYRTAKKPYIATKKVDGDPVTGRLHDYDRLVFHTPVKPADLPRHIQDIAIRFPELCDPNLKLPEFPMLNTGAFGSGLPQNSEADLQVAEIMKRIGDVLETAFIELERGRPEKEAILLSMKLRTLLSKAEASERLIAPEYMDRRGMATGDDQPWYQLVDSGVSIARHLTIVFDVSGSMYSCGRLTNARISAQALCLALEAEGGSVCGGQFGAYGVLHPEYNANPLFSQVMHKSKITSSTSFQLVASIWMKRPTDTVIVITDGAGQLPDYISAQDKDRTHVICIGNITSSAEQLGHTYLLKDNELDKLPELMTRIAD